MSDITATPNSRRRKGRNSTRKGQHHRMASAYRNFKPIDILTMSKKKLDKLWLGFAFPLTVGEPYCPKCGSLRWSWIKTRNQYSCTDCGRRYSKTSGTVFAYRKLKIRKILHALAMFQNKPFAQSAPDLANEIGVSYKTAWVLAHKVRNLMAFARRNDTITEDVAVDGAYFGGVFRRQNIRTGKEAEKKDRRLKHYRDEKRKKVVVAIKHRSANTTILAKEFKSESAAVQWVQSKVPMTATIYTDQGSWNDLGLTHVHETINHKHAFKLGDCDTNTVESFFGSLRKAEDIHICISRNYFQAYVDEQVWRRSARKFTTNLDRFLDVASCIGRVVSSFRGYWQRSVGETA